MHYLHRLAFFLVSIFVVSFLFACAAKLTDIESVEQSIQSSAFNDSAPLPMVILQAKSRWTPVRWHELPGWAQDNTNLHDAWHAWLNSCSKPASAMVQLCEEVKTLKSASGAARRAWMMQKLQPYRVDSLQDQREGLLTSYFEPVLQASRQPRPGFTIPIYRPPVGLNTKRPWFSRQEMETSPQVKTLLRGSEIAYVANPIDALILQIQGSGRVNMIEADGSRRTVRFAYAATNEHTYKSVGRWLLDQGATRDVSWAGIKNWAANNPQRVSELMWSNPRVVFFREEAMPDIDIGPKGAQGVPLTPGRSIAVDRASIPYGTPVWLSSDGVVRLQKLVLAQDTGSAITGAVRADYFAGWGDEAGELANRIKQPLQLWVLWPK